MSDHLHQGLAAYDSSLADAGGLAVHASQHPTDALAVVLYSAPPYHLVVPPMAVSRLSINLTPGRVDGGLDGDRQQAFQTRRHSVFVTPAGAAAVWRKASSSRHINIYFGAQALEHRDDAEWGALLSEAVPMLNVRMHGTGSLVDMLAAELTENRPFNAEAIDSLARLILVRLARHPVLGAARSNPLTPALLARLTDFIQARLDHRVMVSDLAAVVGLPPNRFAQAFTRAVGQAPHQYVMTLRLERAGQLVRQSSDGLADIAAACGFASQQHMTQVMRRRLGITPGRQRAQAAFDPR